MGSNYRTGLAAIAVVVFLFTSQQAEATSKRRHFENRRTAEEYVHSLVRAREFLNALGLTEIVANGAAQDKLNSEFVFLPTKLESPGLKYALVDSRLKLNPQDVGRVLKHSSGSIGVQLATDSLSGHQQIAIHLVGFEAGEVASALASYQAMYLSSAVTKSAGGRAPASEVRSGTGGSNVQSVASADDRSAAEQVWSSFRACGGGIVRGFNQIVLYPVYALNSAWVYVFGDALGIGKVDDAQFAKDPVQAVFASDKKRYRSAFSQGWEEYWSREKKAANAVVDGFREYKTILAKGYHGYVGMSAEEKSAFNCALTSGLGTAALAKVATQASVKVAQASAATQEVAVATQASRVVEAPAGVVARQRAATREVPRQPAEPPSIKGLEVREIANSPDGINVPPDDLMKIYGKFDPSKIKRAPEPPKPPAGAVATGKRYSAILDVGDGNKMPVQFEVLTSPSPRGFVQIRYENPLHRGQLTERSIRWGELEVSPGFREINP